ncbi:hypothetical protein B7Z00_00100 [Candidatus Saccharibacteria bacterium 32-50-10]|nr:MAG: hypothetical protein B7Z00_00100 [Candidatus Saccharibacteria bacterium 32-50-10]
MDQFIVIALGLLGAALGSFAGAQVWRLRARQLESDRNGGEDIDEKEFKRLKPLLGKTVRQDRSRCLSCGHQLAWYDLLPIVSWIALGGKCRYCGRPIGKTEFLVELSLGLLFTLSFVLWPGNLAEPLELAKLVLWLSALVALAINFIYDARWLLLVPSLNWLLIILGALYSGITAYQSADPVATMLSIAGAVIILGGLYGLLWLISRGRWIGEGDIYLGAGLALFLADWQLAFVVLFAANLIGTFMITPLLLSGKMERGAQIPFGPLLIVGAVLSWFAGNYIVEWYQSLLVI